MKDSLFLLVFLGTQLLLAALQVDKQNRIAAMNYALSADMNKLKALTTEYRELLEKLCKLKNLENIYQFARKKLKMEPVRPNQVLDLKSLLEDETR